MTYAEFCQSLAALRAQIDAANPWLEGFIVMSDWNRTLYECYVCGRTYPDYIGGSVYCSIACRADDEALVNEELAEEDGGDE
jgi:hypothetical protein